jgi:hypothetical protein
VTSLIIYYPLWIIKNFYPPPDKQSGYEVENQAVIDKINRISYIILYIYSGRYTKEELAPFLVHDSEYVREAAKEVYDRLENHENSLVHPKNDKI